MNNQDEISLVSSLAPSLASIIKKLVKVVVLTHKSYVHNYLGGRIIVAI